MTVTGAWSLHRSPCERPELGQWLRRPDEFDGIVWWRLDRAVRSMADMAELGKWAKQHGKLLLFAEGPGGAPFELDMRSVSPVSELIMMMLAFSAQMESQAISERVAGAHAALRSQGRYSGGLAPWGFTKAPNPNGPGFVLAHDPDALPALLDVIRRVVAGEGLTAIINGLNDDGTPTPRDYQALQAGRPTGGMRGGVRLDRFRWTTSTLSKALRSPTLLGYRTHQGRTVRDHAGEPVLIGPPILTRDEFATLGECLAAKTPQKNRTRKDTDALLLGVAKCAGCGLNLYKSARKGAHDYVCRASSRGVRCPAASSMRADWLDDYAEAQLMQRIGAWPMTRVVTHRGYDPGPELREIETELRALYASQASRQSTIGRRIWQEEVDALERRAGALEAAPAEPTRTETVETGETYAEFWDRSSTAERRQMLREMGVTVTVRKGKAGGDNRLRVAADESRLTFAIGQQERLHASRRVAGARHPLSRLQSKSLRGDAVEEPDGCLPRPRHPQRRPARVSAVATTVPRQQRGSYAASKPRRL
ncbi:recombinase family protein [Streptomyces sp. NPDC005794]|uniref:recombinase family protein n=1 Tax=Streptomyces sp. NPDC005794 TaxID=3364733 RepID=UPI00367CA1B7